QPATAPRRRRAPRRPPRFLPARRAAARGTAVPAARRRRSRRAPEDPGVRMALSLGHTRRGVAPAQAHREPPLAAGPGDDRGLRPAEAPDALLQILESHTQSARAIA